MAFDRKNHADPGRERPHSFVTQTTHGPPPQRHQHEITHSASSPSITPVEHSAPHQMPGARGAGHALGTYRTHVMDGEREAAQPQGQGEGHWICSTSQTHSSHSPSLASSADKDLTHSFGYTLVGAHQNSLTYKRDSQTSDAGHPLLHQRGSILPDNATLFQSHPHSTSSPLQPHNLPRPDLSMSRVASSLFRSSASPAMSGLHSQPPQQTSGTTEVSPPLEEGSMYTSPSLRRVRRVDTSYPTSIHPLEQSSPLITGNSPRQGYTAQHMSLSGRDLFEGVYPVTDYGVPEEYGVHDQEGSVSSRLSTSGLSLPVSRGRERHSVLQEGASAGDWPSFRDSLAPPSSVLERPTQLELEANMPLGSRSQDCDSEGLADTNDKPVLPSAGPSQLPAAHPRFEKPKEEQSDIERYSRLIMKTSSQLTSNGLHQVYGSYETDMERGNSSRTIINIPDEAGPGLNDAPHTTEKAGNYVQDIGATTSPAHTLFSFRSIKSNILSRLFGSQALAGGSGGSTSFQRLGLNRQGHIQQTNNQDSNTRSQNLPAPSHPLAAGSSIALQRLNYEEHADDLTRNMNSSGIQPSRSGGILSNLLKIQALSMPTSSRQHRQRRRHHRQNPSQHPRQRKANRKSSFASDIALTRPSRYAMSSPSASVLSLPGLLRAAPSGVGLSPNTALPSAAMPSSQSSTFLNTPTTDNGLHISTSVGAYHGYKPTGGEYSNGNSPTTLPPSPERLGGESTQYLQTRSAYSTHSSISMDDAASMYSTVSQDPLMTAIRLTQQVELAEAVADILQRQDLLIRLCKSFIRYGAPSHRIEHAMEAMCKIFGIDGSFAFLPGLMMISFGDTDTHTSETHLVKCAQGFDMGRLAKVHKIARALVNGDLEPGEALANLKAVNNEKPLYNIWVMLAAFAGTSGLIAPLIFKGGWYDMLASMGLGIVVGLTTLLANKYSVYSSVFEVSTSILVAFMAKALGDYVCFTGVVLSAIVMLLPGLSLTTAIMELSSRYMISGSVRMFYSLIYCLFLGFGLSIGSNLYDAFREPLPGDMKMGYCHPATEPWRWILFPLLGISLSIQLYTSPRQWLVVVVISSVGYAVSELAGLYWPHALHIAAAVSAFVAGLLGNIYERVTHELAFVPILGAILLIVPGGMGVRSTLLLLDQSGDGSQGTSFALQMILVALGIAVGLFAATFAVYPLGKKRNALLTF